MVCAYHVGRLRVELYLVGSSCLDLETAFGNSSLCLDKEYSVDTFMTIESHGGSISEDSDAFHLFDSKTVNRAFHTVDKNKNILLACSLGSTDAE